MSSQFTLAQVERMLEAGDFDGQRLELIDGTQVRVQPPMDVGPADRERSQPEPDFV